MSCRNNLLGIDRRVSRWVTVGMLLVVIGCEDATEDSVPRVGVTGRVTLDGHPLKAAAIVFRSVGANNQTSVVTSHAFIEDGYYSIGAESGPAVGAASVEFRPKPLAREVCEAALDEKAVRRRPPQSVVVEIPERYAAESTLRVVLESGGENVHNFKLTTRP